MQDSKLYKLTGAMSLGFGIYCFILAFLVIALDLVYFSIIFALFILFIGIFYAIAGLSILRRGRHGYIVLFGFFGSTFWWSSGIEYYYWPMIIMPMIILVMMLALFVRQFVAKANE